MIRRHRGPEPAELAQARAWRVARALLYPPDTPDTEGYNLSEIREPLRAAQWGRCAYCGLKKVEAGYYDLEHYRPRDLYWWLTWTWENLWIACNTCQSKSNDFPVEPRTQRLPGPVIDAVPASFALSTEQPMLLDPARDQPEQHLCFEEDEARTGKWDWSALSERGRETIKVLHLSRRTTDVDHIKGHLRRTVRGCAEAVLQAGPGEKRAAWARCRADVLWQDPDTSTEADYLVPTWWYLKAFFERHQLASHGLTMWPYPDNAQGDPVDPEPFDLQGLIGALPAEARLHVIYISHFKSAPRPHTAAAIRALCADRAYSVRTLADLLNRSERIINRYLQAQ